MTNLSCLLNIRGISKVESASPRSKTEAVHPEMLLDLIWSCLNRLRLGRRQHPPRCISLVWRF